jgi:hypothetical protein
MAWHEILKLEEPKLENPMKTRTVFLTLLMVAGTLSLPAFASARRAAGSGCNPNGHQFDLEPVVNAPLAGQANESVGFILGRGGNGVDLVVGAAEDVRVLNPVLVYDGFPFPAYYVQRDNSTCAPDFEGGTPTIGSYAPFGETVQVAADPARDAFFMTNILFGNGDQEAVGIFKSTSANLLNATNCPNGTQNNPAACWNIGVAANAVPVNSGYSEPVIAVDQRTQGTGAGDVYVAAKLATFTTPGEEEQISLMACTNSALNCSTSVIVSGTDTLAWYSSVQVRPDGGITVSYANIVFRGNLIFEYAIKFVNCTPQGAPNPPTCKAPILVTNAKHLGTVVVGDEADFGPVAYPWHVDRLEADGKTVTTFLIYDQCAVAQFATQLIAQDCPKTQVAIASSTDGGNTWSSFQAVSPNTPGQQFLGNIALDASTGTVNIAYYSTQNDPMQLRTQVFLAQIPLGQTTVGKINQITQNPFDGQPSCVVYGNPALACGAWIGVAAAGTGQKGQSRVYIHFTGSTSNGSFNGQAFPIYANTLTRFDY